MAKELSTSVLRGSCVFLIGIYRLFGLGMNKNPDFLPMQFVKA